MKERRAEMIANLGGVCDYCGTTWKLEFHHTSPRDWKPSDYNQWSRLKRYQQDIDAGIIVLACRSCNASIGHPDDDLPEDSPF